MKKELRDKISKATKKAMESPIIREKIRLSKIGKTSPRKGMTHSEVSKQKMREAHKNQTPWNKGKTDQPKHTEEHIEKRVSQFRGKDNSSWKGDNVSYGGVHCWITKKYGKANCCENKSCAKKSITYQWANVSGEYKRDRKDFMKLCLSCHRKYDNGSLPLVVIKGQANGKTRVLV